jgi:hypothetical protein
MTLKYLLGPVSADWAARYWSGPRSRGECLAFNAQDDADLHISPGDSWNDVEARLPAGWRPDAVFLYLAYTVIPEGLWSAPIPLVGLAADWNLLWHGYRRILPCCERVWTDAPGVAVMRHCGWAHGRVVNLYGPEPALLGLPLNGPERDIDVLFVGNLSASVQRERLPWLARLARLPGRRVVVRTGVFGKEHVALLRRARIVFNRAIRGECNRRAFEAACGGALLFQERGNVETGALFRDQKECVYYGADDLEELLEHYLDHEEQRRALAAAGHARVQEFGFEVLWREALAALEAEGPEVRAAAARRPRHDAEASLLARTRQALSAEGPPDLSLAVALDEASAARPRSAALHQARGLIAGEATRAADGFRQALACDSDDAVAGLSLVEALAAAGHKDLAVEGARRTLLLLGRGGGLPPRALDAAPFPSSFGFLRVEWERAAWSNAGRRRRGRRQGGPVALAAAGTFGRADRRFDALPRGGPGPARPAHVPGRARLRLGPGGSAGRGPAALAAGRGGQPLRLGRRGCAGAGAAGGGRCGRSAAVGRGPPAAGAGRAPGRARRAVVRGGPGQ